MSIRMKSVATFLMLIACAFSLAGVNAEADESKSESKPAYPTSSDDNKALADDAKRPAAIYLTMSDGVKIACDVWLPKDYVRKAEDAKALPAIMRMTRYWRELHSKNPDFDSGVLVDSQRGEGYGAHGYAYVTVDARGTGASFGTRSHPWSKREIRDYGEIADWISKQAWSNGRIGAVGVSYDGNTAEFIAANMHPAVKVIVPQFDEFDVYHQVAHPGGVFNDWFIKNWGATNSSLDSNNLVDLAKRLGYPLGMVTSATSGAKPVDADTDQKMRDAAVKEHEGNGDVYAMAKAVTFRDVSVTKSGVVMDDLSPFSRKSEIEKSKVLIYAMASWLDAGTAEGALARSRTYSNTQRVVIGPWSHGGGANRSPLPGKDNEFLDWNMQQQLLLSFLDGVLKGSDEEVAKVAKETKSGINYYVHGTGEWRSTASWPPEEHTKAASKSAVNGREHWNFTDKKGMIHVIDPETKKFSISEVKYKVDFTATTGTNNRWQTQLRKEVDYKDRRIEDKKLLTFTETFDHDVEIIGSPVLTLTMKSDRDDGAVFAYLEMFNPKTGASTYITEGMLRLMHRKASDAKTAPYHQFGTYHSYKKADALEVKKGEWMTFDITLFPTAVHIPAGMALRVAIGGHDADTFQRYPEKGDLTYTFRVGAPQTCGINLPIRHFPKKEAEGKEEKKD